MVMFVTLEQASDHLRRDTDDDDNDLTLKIEAASQAILNYIDPTIIDFDSAGEAIDVPRPIQAATLILLGQLYVDRDAPDFRDGKTAPRWGDIILPRTVQFLLDPYRIPLMI